MNHEDQIFQRSRYAQQSVHAFPSLSIIEPPMASIARGFNVSRLVHLAAIMIYEAAPLSRTVSAWKLEMRSRTHAHARMCACAHIHARYVSTFFSKSPVSRVHRPRIVRYYAPLNASLVPCCTPRCGRPLRGPTSRYLPSRGQVGMRVHGAGRLLGYYRPNTEHRWAVFISQHASEVKPRFHRLWVTLWDGCVRENEKDWFHFSWR